MRPLAWAAAALAALVIGFYAASRWATWLFYLHRSGFGSADPILGHDIGFYFFTLPLLELVHGQLLGALLLTTVAVVAAHVLGGNLSLDPVRGLFIAAPARRHIAVLAAAVLLVLAFGAWLQIPQLLATPSGVVFGASYVDVHARIPALRLLIVAALAGAGLAAWQAFALRLWPIVGAIALYVGIAVGGGVYASIIQRFVAGPNEQVRETPFITHNIKATREGA